MTVRKISAILFLVGIALFCYSQNKNQQFLRAEGKHILNQNNDSVLLRGMGLGGWMIQEGYMLQTAGFANAQYQIRQKIEDLIGAANTDTFYNAWLANHVRKPDIDSLKSWGFNSVRLPMHYNLFTLPIEEEPVAGENTWLSKGFELTDSLILWCAQNEMYVILDLHAAPGGQGYDQGICDYDPSKPSLWESSLNKNKTIALWKKLAERYATEPWVAGYDLLNEPNWELSGNSALRQLYQQITDSIRSVDSNHILFIEGNWFANDFTGLTPPWDNNMVYSPHKYWSNNDEATIQWVLDIRNNYNVPLYFGECGENSNVWFRDAIRLFEDYGIGWAWWPMKKVESISCPLAITKTTQYQILLDYWNGSGTAPSAAFAKEALMELTDLLKTGNCHYQQDVVDAMFRQVYSETVKPFKSNEIPGVIYSSDFDMGVIGKAYFDTESANYQVSTGSFTPWNTGWMYRNDGVDIQVCSDNINNNGFNIAWIETGEWLNYSVKVQNSAAYNIQVRLASGTTGGKFHFEMGNATIALPSIVLNTGGWQNWSTVFIYNAIIYDGDNELKFCVDNEGFNISSFEFIEAGDILSVATEFMYAETHDHRTIRMNTNKFLTGPLPVSPAGFEIYLGSNVLSVGNLELDAVNPRIVYLAVDTVIMEGQTIWISYNGNAINATDGTPLENFLFKEVKNTLQFGHPVPGKIEAEDFMSMEGVELETTTDVGGGQNVGYLDPGDYLEYEIIVTQSGNYRVDYRTAAQYGIGALQLQLIDNSGNTTALHSTSFNATGGWQTWATSSDYANLTTGRHTIRLLITQAPFNLNWIEFVPTFSIENPQQIFSIDIEVYPNPGSGNFLLKANWQKVQDVTIELRNIFGNIIYSNVLKKRCEILEQLDVSTFPDGIYELVIKFDNDLFVSKKLVKISE